MVNKISFCIPSKNNLRYLKRAIGSIRENCIDKTHEILIWIDGDEDGTSEWLLENAGEHEKWWVNENDTPFGIGNAYDFLVEQAENDLVMMYHADMIAGEGFDVELLKHHKKGVVVAATRIEPPLHPPEECKITEDFGLWPEEDVPDGFKYHEFQESIKEYKKQYANKTTPGVFAPWLIHKEDYDGVGGHDPMLNSLAEDNDIFNRLHLNGIQFIQTWEALVYHLTCRGGQFEHAEVSQDLQTKSEAWTKLSYEKTRDFMRKWGFGPMSTPLKEPIVWPRIKVHAEITGWSNSSGMYNLLRNIEPYFASLTIDNAELERAYIDNEQQHTQFDLKTKFLIGANSPKLIFNINNLRHDHFNTFLTKLPLIIDSITVPGTYQHEIFTLQV